MSVFGTGESECSAILTFIELTRLHLLVLLSKAGGIIAFS
jgi:hypothetical protein